MRRDEDWLRQAERDLRHAKNALEDGDYEWSCFASQQAVEKALKAIYENRNMDVRGDSILGLLKGLSTLYDIPAEFYPYARKLTRYYIEARYPNGFPEGAPYDYFDRARAEEAVDEAEEIIGWCRDILSR